MITTNDLGVTIHREETIACTCATIGAPNVVRFSACHHRYHRGDKELASVSRVIRETWPVKKTWEDADPAVLENARDRGVVTDYLFSEWIASRLKVIPAGIRKDAIDRFQALRQWWIKTQNDTIAESQYMLADDEIAGTCDLLTKQALIMDVKNVYALDPSYWLQLGGYADLYEKQFGEPAAGAALVHVTQPSGKPVSIKYVEIDVAQAITDWRALRAVWNIVKRVKP